MRHRTQSWEALVGWLWPASAWSCQEIWGILECGAFESCSFLCKLNSFCARKHTRAFFLRRHFSGLCALCGTWRRRSPRGRGPPTSTFPLPPH